MTLIIGCITPKFGIIVGDSQATVGNPIIGGRKKRESQLKLFQPDNNIIYGILGKWTNYFCNKEEPTQFNPLNYHHLMEKRISNTPNKVDSIGAFLFKKLHIDPTVLLIEKSNQSTFRLWEISNSHNYSLSRFDLGQATIAFNEPFSSVNSNFVKDSLNDFSKTMNLNDCLSDICFLMNNVLLNTICLGEDITIKDNLGKKRMLYDGNTVGGIVTMSIIPSGTNHCYNLHQLYTSGISTLLDQTTSSFARSLETKKGIRYINNLAMIIGNINNPYNKLIEKDLVKWANRQIEYIIDREIIDAKQLNSLIEYVNKKYSLNLDIQPENKEHDPIISLGFIFENDGYENNSFYRRFFKS